MLTQKGNTVTVWRPPTLDEQPELELAPWRIVQLTNGDRHLVGYHVRAREGRVSNVVVDFDYSTMVCTTRHGRRYRLHGRPGFNSDADYVWQRWRRLNDVDQWTDVTEEAWAAHLATRT